MSLHNLLARPMLLSELMREHKISNEKLAEDFDVQPETISNWRTGKVKISDAKFLKIIAYFKEK